MSKVRSCIRDYSYETKLHGNVIHDRWYISRKIKVSVPMIKVTLLGKDHIGYAPTVEIRIRDPMKNYRGSVTSQNMLVRIW